MYVRAEESAPTSSNRNHVDIVLLGKKASAGLPVFRRINDNFFGCLRSRFGRFPPPTPSFVDLDKSLYESLPRVFFKGELQFGNSFRKGDVSCTPPRPEGSILTKLLLVLSLLPCPFVRRCLVSFFQDCFGTSPQMSRQLPSPRRGEIPNFRRMGEIILRERPLNPLTARVAAEAGWRSLVFFCLLA